MKQIKPSDGTNILRFADFEMNCENREIRRSGKQLRLSGQPLDILECLVRHSGKLVRREDLKSLLWPKATGIETNRRLNTAIRALRTALETSEADSVRVETLRNLGYRLIVEQKLSTRIYRFAAVVVIMLLIVSLALLRIDAVRGTSAGQVDAPGEPEQMAQYFRAVAAYEDGQRISESAHAELLALNAEHPEFLPARLLEAKVRVVEWRHTPNTDTLEAARKGLLSLMPDWPNNSDVYALLGELALYGDWDWAASERYLKRAIDRDRSHRHARQVLAWLYLNSNRTADTWVQLHALLATAPLAPATRADMGWLLLRLGENHLALSLCQLPETKTGGRLNLLSCQHTAQARIGLIVQARATALRLMHERDASPNEIAAVTASSPVTGYQHFLRWRVGDFARADNSWFRHAQRLAEAGLYDAAADGLNRAFEARDPLLIKLASTPEFEKLLARPSIKAIWIAVKES